jgi:hypothetical protein
MKKFGMALPEFIQEGSVCFYHGKPVKILRVFSFGIKGKVSRADDENASFPSPNGQRVEIRFFDPDESKRVSSSELKEIK